MKDLFVVTGGAGFVGANVVRGLIKKGEQVHVLVKKETNPWRLADLDMVTHVTDLQDEHYLKGLLMELQPTHILHMASYGQYLGKQQDYELMFKTNVIGTLKLLNASADVPYKSFINIGSSSEYGVKEKPMNELDLLEPVNIYGTSKASQTLLCQTYSRITQKPIITLRLFSVYGSYEPKGRLFPNVTLHCLRNEPVHLTAGIEARDFIYVDDVVECIYRLTRCDEISAQIINLGSGRTATVGKMARLIKRLTGSTSELRWGVLREKGIESTSWVANISELVDKTGWRPTYDLEKGVETGISWFQQNLKLY